MNIVDLQDIVSLIMKKNGDEYLSMECDSSTLQFEVFSLSKVSETLVMPDVFEDEKKERKSSKEIALIWVERMLLFLLWATLQFIFLKLEFGAVFFICSIFYLIWRNLRTRPQKPGELSAYSVFNKNCRPIHGTVTAEQLQREFFLPGL